ncbi:MAG: RNA polymerase sigma factor [Gemmatimonadota bacterium]
MTEPPSADRRAVAAFLRDRDEAAFDVLYDRHTPRLYGLALRLAGGDEDEAAEAVQEAWVRAIPKLGTFRWRSSLGTWLGSIVVNCWRERRRRRDRAPEIEWDASVEASVPGAPERPGVALDVARALDSLPTGYRTVLVLFGVYGYSHDEIAALLDISTGTSKSQLSRARTALRRALA